MATMGQPRQEKLKKAMILAEKWMETLFMKLPMPFLFIHDSDISIQERYGEIPCRMPKKPREVFCLFF